MGDDLRRNAEGYSDPTAQKAIENIESTEAYSDENIARFHRLLDAIFSICELSVFHIEGRIVIKDQKTGKIWR